jgi:lipopolysaccharide/colanic/teichoic acid biosynthesis glycosyltransferase
VAKRLFDLIAASVGLLLLSPLFVGVAIAIRRSSPGPVFFRQVRVGLHGEPFSMLKFRTMRPDAERVGGQLTVGADPRITPIGHTLRRYKLDEFPQLINVVLGDMSLVGPRPEVPRYVALYDDRQRRVLDVRPGITDPASIAYRDENALLANAEDPEATYVHEVMPAKLEINLAYLERRSLLRDIGVILQTLAAVVRR